MAIPARRQPNLSDVQLLLLRLAESIDRAMISTRQALLSRDLEEAAHVLNITLEVARLRAEIETEAHRLLAQQPAPLGEELRSVTATLMLARELCQIGECACAIVTIVMESPEFDGLNVLSECNQIAYRAREMLQEAMRAVVTRDAGTFERLRVVNDCVVLLHERIRQALLLSMRTQAELSEMATNLLWVAYYLKCMADGGMRIAERAAFIATGSWSFIQTGNGSPAARPFAHDAS